MSMIEKMARAMADHIGAAFYQMPRNKKHFMELSREGKSGVFDINGPFQDDCLNAAKAALSALSDPTEGMVEVGHRAFTKLSGTLGPEPPMPTQVLRAMIKAAEDGA